MGKASLALTFAVIVAVVVAASGGRQAVAQVTTATVDQYLTQVGEDAATTSQSFRESRSGESEPLAATDAPSDTSSSAVNAPSASSRTTGDNATAAPGPSANAPSDGQEDIRQAFTLSRLPETGGPSAATLLWGLIALMSLLPCLGIMRAAHRGDER